MKEMNNVDSDLIMEAQNPQPRRHWNGNYVRVAAAAACVTLFVGGVGVASLNSNNGGDNPAASESTLETDDVKHENSSADTVYIIENGNSETEIIVSEKSSGLEEETKSDTVDRMIVVEGVVYTSTGEVIYGERSCIMNGTIISSVEQTDIPYEDNQSNFGEGYAYQKVDAHNIDVYIDGAWIRFNDEKTVIPSEWETQSEESETSQIAKVDSELASMQVANPDKLSSTGGEFVIFNNTGSEGYAGEDYFLNRKAEDGTWQPCEVTGVLAWNDIAWILNPGEQRIFSVDWKESYGNLEPGMYQLVKIVNVAEENLTLNADFTIE